MNDQDDEKKIIEEERSQPETENQSKVDENNQPEGVDNQKNDPIPDTNQNNNENTDQTQNLDTSSEKKDEDNGSSHEVIHKKDGRLHIYIRQDKYKGCLLYTSPSPRDRYGSRMPSSA